MPGSVPSSAQRWLGTVALGWRHDECGEGICHGHEHTSHCRHGPGIHHACGPGIITGMDVASATSMASHCGHKHGMATSAMGVKKTSTRGTDAATITITTHGITASSLDGLLPSQLGPKGTPQPLNTQIKPFNHS